MLYRKHQRIRYEVPAVVNVCYGTGPTTSHAAQARDISVAGLCLLLSETMVLGLEEGVRSHIVVRRSQPRPDLHLEAEVVRLRITEDGRQEIVFRYIQEFYEVMAVVTSHESVIVEVNPYGV